MAGAGARRLPRAPRVARVARCRRRGARCCQAGRWTAPPPIPPPHPSHPPTPPPPRRRAPRGACAAAARRAPPRAGRGRARGARGGGRRRGAHRHGHRHVRHAPLPAPCAPHCAPERLCRHTVQSRTRCSGRRRAVGAGPVTRPSLHHHPAAAAPPSSRSSRPPSCPSPSGPATTRRRRRARGGGLRQEGQGRCLQRQRRRRGPVRGSDCSQMSEATPPATAARSSTRSRTSPWTRRSADRCCGKGDEREGAARQRLAVQSGCSVCPMKKTLQRRRRAQARARRGDPGGACGDAVTGGRKRSGGGGRGAGAAGALTGPWHPGIARARARTEGPAQQAGRQLVLGSRHARRARTGARAAAVKVCARGPPGPVTGGRAAPLRAALRLWRRVEGGGTRAQAHRRGGGGGRGVGVAPGARGSRAPARVSQGRGGSTTLRRVRYKRCGGCGAFRARRAPRGARAPHAEAAALAAAVRAGRVASRARRALRGGGGGARVITPRA